MMVFAHHSVYTMVKDVDTSRVSCGVANLVFNKGAIAIGFKLLNKSFLFICSHLACKSFYIIHFISFSWIEK